jgi:hypothetical protein
MTLRNRLSLCLVLPLGWFSAYGQSLDGAGRDLTPAADGSSRQVQTSFRFEDWQRRVRAGGREVNLDMRRAVLAGEWAMGQGASLWGEGGWNDPDFAGGEGGSGLTWGAGGAWRALRAPLRTDPEFGPREWVALLLSGGLRGGSADDADGEITWTQLEGRLGVEWRNPHLLPRRAGSGLQGWTLDGGLVWNSLEADRGDIDGSESEEVGFYGRMMYQLSQTTHAGVEVDWFGGSDRRLAFAASYRF